MGVARSGREGRRRNAVADFSQHEKQSLVKTRGIRTVYTSATSRAGERCSTSRGSVFLRARDSLIE